MKRWGTITLMLFAFLVGFMSTYNCGGGSSADAAGDADTLQGHPAADFAMSVHDHPGYATTAMLASHTHGQYANSSHSHLEYMDAVGTCSSSQVLKWSGTMWVCGDDLDSTDADTLDGSDSSDFALSSHSHSSSSTTQYISVSFLPGVPINAFYAQSNKISNIWSDGDQFANADTSIVWVGRSAIYATTTSYIPLYVPVQIPHGANVVEFGILYYDEIPGDPTIVSYLQRTLGSPDGLRLATVRGTVADIVPQYAWTTSINPVTKMIDNTSYGYHIRGQVYGQEPMALLSAFVGYVMP